MEKKPKRSRFRHIVLFKLHDNIDDEKINTAIHLLQEFGEKNDGVLEWEIEKSIDSRKDIIIIENGLFVDEQSFNLFRNSDKHKKAGEFMRRISDWLIGDYIQD